jgi:hypothetical protein
MSKIHIDPSLTGKSLFQFLTANKGALVSQKKAGIKTTEAVSANLEHYIVRDKSAQKAATADIPEDVTTLRVKFVGNAFRWCDSQMDVLIDDCAKKTISEGHGRLHIKDHVFMTDSEVGDVVAVYLQDVPLVDLGLAQGGTTQCIVYESDVQKAMNEKIFNRYRKNKQNQHSIGLRYVKIELAINDSDYEKEMDFWNKYYPLVINKEAVDERGFFWVVTEIKLIEVSAVLAGANELTPTLDISESTPAQPGKSTEQEPPKESQPAKSKYENLVNAISKS